MHASAALEDERRRVFDHRLEQFLTLGFPYEESRDLAYADVDWHEIEQMLKNGCTHELVLQIRL